jgi:hypothetical protein
VGGKLSAKKRSRESERVPYSALTTHTKQPLGKHRAKSSLRNKQQHIPRSKSNSYCIHRMVHNGTPQTTGKNSLQLLQAGFKPEQERGLRDQVVEVLSVFAMSPGGMA